MDTFNLRALVAVIDRRSVSAAAQQLSMSRAGVSMLLHRLEAYYRVKLVQRRAGGLAPTAAGLALYRYAIEVLRLEALLGQQLERERARTEGWVGLGALPSITRYLLPPILSVYRERHPEWQVTVETSGLAALSERVASGQLDFAVMGAPTGGGLCQTPIRRERVLIVAAPSDPLAAQGEVAPAELLRHPFVVAGRNSDLRRRLEAALGNPRRVRLQVALEVSDSEAKKEAVRQGVGYGLVSEWSVARELREGTLREVTVPGLTLSREICLVHSAERALSPAAAALFELIRESAGDHCPALAS
jgi:LysR family nitrogen assimilation transcriptional regulator